METALIKTKRDYRRALKEIEGLMTAERNTPDGDRLDVLTTLVEAWEARHYPLDSARPGGHTALSYGAERTCSQGPRSLHPAH